MSCFSTASAKCWRTSIRRPRSSSVGASCNRYTSAWPRRCRKPLRRIVFTETSYLREILRFGPRTFTVYTEPLVGSRTNFRNLGNRYFVVLNPTVDSSREVGHAYLHFLIDPLPLQYSQQILGETRLFPIAGRAPRLPPELRSDWAGFFTECMVRAVELRLRRLTPAQLADEVNSAEGMVTCWSVRSSPVW